MTPGSLYDWPIQEQEPLFTIFGDIESIIGLRLRDSFMIDPRQSASGILFPTEIGFQTCMLCLRQGCPKRRLLMTQTCTRRDSGRIETSISLN
jgi:hypothetical protein